MGYTDVGSVEEVRASAEGWHSFADLQLDYCPSHAEWGKQHIVKTFIRQTKTPEPSNIKRLLEVLGTPDGEARRILSTMVDQGELIFTADRKLELP